MFVIFSSKYFSQIYFSVTLCYVFHAVVVSAEGWLGGGGTPGSVDIQISTIVSRDQHAEQSGTAGHCAANNMDCTV